MAKCENQGSASGVKFKAWTGDAAKAVLCTVNSQDNRVFHCIEIVNQRGKSCQVDVQGRAERDPPVLEFKHLPDQKTGSSWQSTIKVRARTKKGHGNYSDKEATVKSKSTKPANTDETIVTEFTYTPDGETTYQPVSFPFDVDY
jgi:hypothetical protein